MRGWLLDTNVVSETARARPDERVLDWLRSVPDDRTYISVLTLAEIDQGIEALSPKDPRRERYKQFRSRLEAEFTGRVLQLDDETVRLWGWLSGQYRRSFGGNAPVIDAMLAATAHRRRLYIATRNVADMRALGISAFDPWTDDTSAYPLQL